MGALGNENFRVLITGSNGQLGQKLVLYCLENEITFLATAISNNKFSQCPNEKFRHLDITNFREVARVVSSFRPTHIINAAAMTNVDACETDIEKCDNINHKGVKNILGAILYSDIHLIQISTDFIFDGKKKMYSELDEANPLGEYGKSKWRGEKVLIESNYENYTILRTSLVYGVGERLNKSNIFSWAMKALREGQQLSIVNDQFRTPTLVNDLAKACFLVIEKNKKGIYNIAGAELKSMYEFIQIVADYVKVDRNQVKPIATTDLNQKAPRPQSSGLDITKAQKDLEFVPTDFKESLDLLRE
ncbi:MAG: SDR family oxidoreductase [Brumimicrobium sp.]